MLTRFVLLVISLLLVFPVLASQAHVAVASNFSHTMRQIEQSFEADTGQQLIVSYGSSGKLFAQITHGAPFDVFLSADAEKPIALIQKQLGVSDTMFTYALGRLFFWNTALETQNLSLTTLNAADFQRLAIANPKLAPYGKAALEVLDNVGFVDKYKLVYGENIAQTFQFVESGNAELGLVAASQITQYTKRVSKSFQDAHTLVPQKMHSPIIQNAILLEKGINNPAAVALLDYLRSDKIVQLIRDSGYDMLADLPAEKK